MNDFMRELLYIVLIICIPYMAALVKKLIGEATDAIAARVKNEKAEKCLREIGDAVADAVDAMNQRYVNDLKKEGKFDKDKQAEILQRAVSAALKSLSSDAQEYLKKTYGDTTEYLENRIEAQIGKNKNKITTKSAT